MWWLWIAGPLAVALIYVLTGALMRDERRMREVSRWKAGFGPAHEDAEDGEPQGAKEVLSIPSDLGRMVSEAGGGAPLAYFELFPRLAYLAVMEANATCGSDHQTVVARLDRTGPTFTARPLPIVEGSRVANTGVQFKKDPELMELFLVEGDDAKAIGKWMKRPIREALREMPDVWLRVRGRMMTLTLYGAADEASLDALIETADLIFAEVGAEGGPSLLGDAELGDDDEDDDGEGGDEDEDEPSDEVAAKPAPKAESKSAGTAKKDAEKKGQPAGSAPTKKAGAVTAAKKEAAKAGAKPSATRKA